MWFDDFLEKIYTVALKAVEEIDEQDKKERIERGHTELLKKRID